MRRGWHGVQTFQIKIKHVLRLPTNLKATTPTVSICKASDTKYVGPNENFDGNAKVKNTTK